MNSIVHIKQLLYMIPFNFDYNKQLTRCFSLSGGLRQGDLHGKALRHRSRQAVAEKQLLCETSVYEMILFKFSEATQINLKYSYIIRFKVCELTSEVFSMCMLKQNLTTNQFNFDRIFFHRCILFAKVQNFVTRNVTICTSSL